MMEVGRGEQSRAVAFSGQIFVTLLAAFRASWSIMGNYMV